MTTEGTAPKADEIAIEFKNVSKRYKLYRSDKHRFLGIFSKRIGWSM